MFLNVISFFLNEHYAGTKYYLLSLCKCQDLSPPKKASGILHFPLLPQALNIIFLQRYTYSIPEPAEKNNKLL